MWVKKIKAREAKLRQPSLSLPRVLHGEQVWEEPLAGVTWHGQGIAEHIPEIVPDTQRPPASLRGTSKWQRDGKE